MFPIIFKFFVYINIVFIIAITIFIIFSKKNEPKVFPEKFSKKYILKYIKNSKLIVTVEEHNIYGALNSCIAEINSKSIYNVKHLPIAINDNYSDGGDYEYLIKKHGINREKIIERILYEFKKFR